MIRWIGMLLASAVLCTGTATAQTLWMVRSAQSFPETMLDLQEAIVDQGYTISRVQRVDIGLTESGFETDKYRIVFFGRPEEVRVLTTAYPQLVPYLPQQIILFAEEQETLVVTVDPLLFQELVKEPAVRATFERWREDVQAILDRLRTAR
jgi:uncharacterized protein (DUF302 family)